MRAPFPCAGQRGRLRRMEAGRSQRDARRGIWFMFVAYAAGALGASVQQHAPARRQQLRDLPRRVLQSGGRPRPLCGVPGAVLRPLQVQPQLRLPHRPDRGARARSRPRALEPAERAGALVGARAALPARRAALIAMLFVAAELFGSLQTAQSNGLVTALVILAWLSLEEGAPVRGAMAIAIGTAIKVFPTPPRRLALFDPRRRRFFLALAAARASSSPRSRSRSPARRSSPSQYRSWQRDRAGGCARRRDAHRSASHRRRDAAAAALDRRALAELADPARPGRCSSCSRSSAGRARWPERSFRLRLSRLAAHLHGDLQPPGGVAVLRDRDDGHRDLVPRGGARARPISRCSSSRCS